MAFDYELASPNLWNPTGGTMIKEMGGDYLQWLRGFYQVAKTGSFSMAGREIGRNQPTISHQIKCLEKEYGVTLFDRC